MSCCIVLNILTLNLSYNYCTKTTAQTKLEIKQFYNKIKDKLLSLFSFKYKVFRICNVSIEKQILKVIFFH